MAMKKSEIKENPFATATTPSIVTPPKQETAKETTAKAETAKAETTAKKEITAKGNPEKIRMSIYVHKSAKDIIEAVAKAKNASVSQLLTDILDNYAKDNEACAKEFFALQERIQTMSN